MAGLFFVEDIVDGNEYAGFLDVTEFGVDCSAEHPHCGGEGHVGVDEGRDSAVVAADELVEDSEVILEVGSVVTGLDFRGEGVGAEWVDGGDEIVGVGEVFVHEPEDHVAVFGAVIGIHRDLAEEVFDLRVFYDESAEAVPEVVEGVD